MLGVNRKYDVYRQEFGSPTMLMWKEHNTGDVYSVQPDINEDTDRYTEFPVKIFSAAHSQPK